MGAGLTYEKDVVGSIPDVKISDPANQKWRNKLSIYQSTNQITVPHTQLVIASGARPTIGGGPPNPPRIQIKRECMKGDS